MTQRRRDDLYREITGVGLDMTAFGFEYGTEAASITHRPTGSTFKVTETFGPTPFDLQWQVPDGPSSDPGDSYRQWTEVLRLLNHWAGEVKYITENVDLWAELQGSRDLLILDQGDIPNASFTRAEQAAISRRVEEIKQQARENPELTARQISGIEQKLDDIVKAGERVGRKDWLTMLYGAAFGMIVNDTVPAHVVQGIITSVISGLGHIFGLGVPLALPPTA
jgi:tetrahydromethanopterin S-methyltransferase subunit G